MLEYSNQSKIATQNKMFDAGVDAKIEKKVLSEENVEDLSKNVIKTAYCKSLQKHPKMHCAACCSLILVMMAVALLAFPLLYGEVDPTNPKAPAKIAFDAIQLARDELDVAQAEDEDDKILDWSFVYQWKDSANKDEDILIPANIQSMCAIEKLLFQFSDYGFQFCDLEHSNKTCVSSINPSIGQSSLAAKVYQSLNSSFNFEECYELSELEVQAFTDQFYFTMQNSTIGRLRNGFFVNSIFSATIARGVISLADVDENGSTSVARKMEDKLFEFCGMKSTFFKSAYRNPCYVDDISVTFANVALVNDELDRLIFSDFTMVFGSVVFVLIWMRYYTGSWILTICFMSYIFSATPVAMFVYKAVLQIKYFDFIHILAVFLIIGIGADSCFVVFDAWKQAKSVFHLPNKSDVEKIAANTSKTPADVVHDVELKRLLYAYNRSTQTTFSTSVTTVVAFATTAITTNIPISTFGIFSALVVSTVYIYTLTIIPATVFIWDRAFMEPSVLDIEGDGVKTNEDKTDLELDQEIPAFERNTSVTSLKNAVSFFSSNTVNRKGSTAELENSQQHRQGHLEDLVSPYNYYYERYYVPLILNHKIPVACTFLALGILGLIGATQLSELTEDEAFLPSDHMIQIYIHELIKVFVSGGEGEFAFLTLSWGLSGVKRDVWSHYTGNEDEYEDKVLYDKEFKLNVETIEAIIDTCEEILQVQCDVEACGDFDELITPESFDYIHICPMIDFKQFYEQNSTVPFANLTVAEIESELSEFMILNPQFNEHLGFVGGYVKFITAKFRMAVSPYTPPPSVRSLESLAKSFINSQVTKFDITQTTYPAGYTLSLNFASSLFVQLSSSEALLKTVIRGLAITFPIVYVILIAGTMNLILATFSALSIGFIITCVLGFVSVVLGWELGTAESIVAIMTVGLSVDYAVHLGHMYSFAAKEEGYFKREDRVHFSALTIAPTVVAGGITTLGAGLFLFGTQITFFYKMGVLLTVTVVLSLLYAMFFLMALSAWLGPQGTVGNVEKYIGWLKGKKA